MVLSSLFVDMNSFFASVEQQYQPALRRRPVAVVPVMADTTVCIAASYEAKKFGVRTGTMVRDAKALCPGLVLAEARHELYIRVHHQFIAAIDACLPVHAVHSIDEVSCRLNRGESDPERAVQKALQIKESIRRHAGEFVRCSIGLAPNTFLAKVATDLEKPDGLVTILPGDLPAKLCGMKLSDLPGIGSQMEKRLVSRGITSVEALYRLSPQELKQAWGSVVGERWWHLLRGYQLPELPARRRSVSHSHVLAPEFRSEPAAHSVLLHLISKGAARLRRLGYSAQRLGVFVSFLPQGRWWTSVSMHPTQDTVSLIQAFEKVWQQRDWLGRPLKVGIALENLTHQGDATLPLFPEERRKALVSKVMDRVNGMIGRNALYLADVHSVRGSAPMRIAFTQIPDLADTAWESLDEFEDDVVMPKIRTLEWVPEFTD